jgi:mannose-6-phosphate isomerase-like protein (cupin superfamily)
MHISFFDSRISPSQLDEFRSALIPAFDQRAAGGERISKRTQTLSIRLTFLIEGDDMAIPVYRPSRNEMLTRTAFFKDLREVSTGLPDMQMHGSRRSFLSVLDFAKPDKDEQVSPTGSDVVPAIVESSAGYGVTYIRAKPGNGVMMHNHNTNESFMVLEGKWTIGWEGPNGRDKIELSKHDFITLPPHIFRDFHCIESGDGHDHGLLLGIVVSISPDGTPAAAEFSDEAKQLMARFAKEQSLQGTTA